MILLFRKANFAHKTSVTVLRVFFDYHVELRVWYCTSLWPRSEIQWAVEHDSKGHLLLPQRLLTAFDSFCVPPDDLAVEGKSMQKYLFSIFSNELFPVANTSGSSSTDRTIERPIGDDFTTPLQSLRSKENPLELCSSPEIGFRNRMKCIR